MQSFIDEKETIYTGTIIKLDYFSLLHGKGQMMTSEGLKYIGQFEYGKRNGPFIVIDRNNEKTYHVDFVFDIPRNVTELNVPLHIHHTNK
jgi:hypothetical protein